MTRNVILSVIIYFGTMAISAALVDAFIFNASAIAKIALVHVPAVIAAIVPMVFADEETTR